MTTLTTFLAAAAIAACGGSDDGGGLSDQDHRDYVAGCVDSGQSRAGCECIYKELTTTQGVDTEEEFSALIDKVGAAAGTAANLPPDFRQATLACRDQLQ